MWGYSCEDDLTHKLVEIVRANITLKRMMSNGSPQHILNEYVSLLQVSRRGAAVLVHCLHCAPQVDKAAADQQARCLVVQAFAYCGVWFCVKVPVRPEVTEC